MKFLWYLYNALKKYYAAQYEVMTADILKNLRYTPRYQPAFKQTCSEATVEEQFNTSANRCKKRDDAVTRVGTA